MNFSLAPPGIISARVFAGAGTGPMLRAATAWDGLAAELRSAAASFGSMASGLASSAWRGPSAAAMMAAAPPYVGWLQSAATQAEQAAGQATVAAGLYEAVRAATVPPAFVAANRSHLVGLVLTNLFGQNAPAIAAAEAQYEQMWAQDVSAMFGYHSTASAVASALTPFTRPLQGRAAQVSQVGSAIVNVASPVGAPASGSAAIAAATAPPGNSSTGPVQHFQRGLRQPGWAELWQRQLGRLQLWQRERREPQLRQWEPRQLQLRGGKPGKKQFWLRQSRRQQLWLRQQRQVQHRLR
ncbi:PPE family protein [Mycobacterium simiae]|uniref:PPE family protein n=1 Tax=Mycobacterium simiae TaxID=1784 RepID=A0A5B1BQ85_MYCSI|nr:PPE family protein [Mycobacterium simiae]